MLQCVAVRCSVLQCVAVCCSVLQCVAVSCSVLQCIAVYCSVLLYCVARYNEDQSLQLRCVEFGDEVRSDMCMLLCLEICCSAFQCVALC